MTLIEFLLARIADDESIAVYGETPHSGPGSMERTLAECEAKRRIIAEWLEFHDPNDPDGPCGCDPATGPREMYEVHDGHADALSIALRAIALPYSDHADYRQEWRP